MEEIPLVYPNNHAETTRRYVVNTNTKRLQVSSHVSSTSSTRNDGDLDEAMQGAASVSTVKLQGQEELLVTTSALIEEPTIISVALSWKKHEEDALESPTMIELDTRDLRVVSVRAFAAVTTKDDNSPSSSIVSDNNNNNKMILVLVGCQGTIVQISLDGNLIADTEAPLKILTREDYIPAPLLEQVGLSDLQGNMISFFPTKNHLIVLALAPLIVTVDWKDTGRSAVWSETQCLEDMATRASPFGGMISNLPSLLWNKMDADVVDMAPTAALCVSTNKVNFNNGDDDGDATAILVFTLHSDASIRKWRIDPESSLYPLEVDTLQGNKLSLPSSWSDGRKSVGLCARVYDQTFALAVHIKTNTLSSYNEGVSDCNIWVFEGLYQAQSTQNDCRIMKVPRDAVSLVGMSFLSSERRCTLSVVFEAVKVNGPGSNKESVSSGIKIISYPPSLLSIVSSEPDVIETTSFDNIATTERDRIRSLPYGSIVLMEIDEDDGGMEEEEEYTTADIANTPVVTVDQALHKLDSLYMKYLFRPIFPRGNGTVLPPSETCIRQALSKLVHGAIKEHGMSVELETIKTLYEWRNRDKRKARIGSPSKLSRSIIQKPALIENGVGLSVYDSFVEPDEDVERTEMVIQDEYDEFEQFEDELITEIESHENRWQRLLYQIWEEEQILRSPLCVSWLESLPVQILVRGNLTTALASDGRATTNDETSWKADLQEASRNIIDVIEADQDKSRTLYEIEEQLTYIVSQAQLAISPQTSITEDLTSLGRWARLQGNSSGDGKLRKLINQIPMKDLVSWIEDKPSDLGIFTTEPGNTQIDGDTTMGSGQQVAKSQLRHASCSCAIRATYSIRRSRLSKYLLLLELAAGSRATFAAFRAYVQTIAILWTSAQRIKMPDIAFQKPEKPIARRIHFDGGSPQNSFPPTKRSSCGDVTSSIFASSSSSTTSLTSALDAVMIKISQDMAGAYNAGSSPFTAITMMSGSYVNLIFASSEKTKGGARSLMPELSVLPKTKDDERPNDHLDLSLRLLAPFVAFQIPDDLPESVVARKEQLSLCLLHAAHSKSFSPGRKSLMREMAIDLLVQDNQDNNNPVQKDYTKKGLDVLKSMGTNNRISVNDIEDRLRQLMHQMIPNTTSVEIVRLCRLSTTKVLFSSHASATESNLDNITYSHTVQIAKLMLHLSRILHRLNILENYITRRGDGEYGDDYNSDSLLQIISDATADMENTFPDDFLRKMPEYISLWSKKFDHAVRASRWSQAYNACVKNPQGEHRDSNFKRLVRAMVDSGSLNELLDMCTQVGIGSPTPLAATTDEYNYEESESIDLYEIASDVLLSYADCDVYDSRATSSCNTNLSDYQGALYALHASQEQWRRAAQSLDLRYVNAKKALLRSTGRAGVNIQTSELRDGLIIQDLVLSACGSANVIQLVKDPDYRFLVSDEYGPYSKLYFGDDEHIEETPNKLKRGRETNETSSKTMEDEHTADRLSKFMVGVHLDGRAIRTVALRTLFFDRSTSYAFAKSAFRRGFDTSLVDIEELFKNGYYQYGLLLAKARSKAFFNGKIKPAGEDLFGNCLYLLMGEYLVPLALSDDEDKQRPTLQQLQTAIDSSGSSEDAASYIVTERSVKLARLEKSAVKAATFALLRKLTITHSTAEIPLAVDIAASFLDQGNNNTQIPVWLERLLLGVDTTAGGAGAFAPRPKAGCNDYLGNPSALLTLYTSRGMFSEACDVVTTILGDNGRASNAVSRLPEKGNIDFVPYRSIDLLWNMIEIACSKGAYNIAEESRILKSRYDMEKALQKNVENMEVSELGMRSARMLS